MTHTHKALPLRRARTDGLGVSLMGLGCMGMSEFYGPSDDTRSRDLILHAIDNGMNFFDTADVYGYGHNETLVGGVLRDHPARHRLVLATKGGIVRDGSDSTRRGIDTSPDYIRQAIERSLDRLQTPIDLYYLHRVEDDGHRIEETMGALAQAMAEGKIGAVGVSEASADTIRRADKALRTATAGAHGLAAVQTEYSLMTRHIEQDGVDAACRELGILLVAYSPICRGLLADPAFDPAQLSKQDFRRTLPRFERENLDHNRQMAKVLFEVARDEGVTPAQLALGWVLSRGPHVVAIPGTRSPQRLDENIGACRIEISPAAMSRLEDTFAPQSAAGTRYTAAAMQTYGLRV